MSIQAGCIPSLGAPRAPIACLLERLQYLSSCSPSNWQMPFRGATPKIHVWGEQVVEGLVWGILFELSFHICGNMIPDNALRTARPQIIGYLNEIKANCASHHSAIDIVDGMTSWLSEHYPPPK